jgi:hypothetical protein
MSAITVDQYAKYLVAMGNANTPAFEGAYADFLRSLGYADAEVDRIVAARNDVVCVSAQ